MIKKILISQPQPASDKSPYKNSASSASTCSTIPLWCSPPATLSIIISTWQKRCASPYLRI